MSSNSCGCCASGSTNVAGDDASGEETTCDATLCALDEYVSSNACTPCATGYGNAADDGASGGDTTCDGYLCAVDEYVSSNACTACVGGETNAAGDDASGSDTTCSCTASSTSSKDGSDGTFYCINGGTAGGTTGSCTCTSCDAGYEGDNCHTAILCAANQRVVSNACTACAEGTQNAAGDEVSGADTTCVSIRAEYYDQYYETQEEVASSSRSSRSSDAWIVSAGLLVCFFHGVERG